MDTSSYTAYAKLDQHQQCLLRDGMKVSDKTAANGIGPPPGFHDYNLTLSEKAKEEGTLKSEGALTTITRTSKAKRSFKGSFRRSISRLVSSRRSRKQTPRASSSTQPSEFQHDFQQARRSWQWNRNEEEEKKDDSLIRKEQEPQPFVPPPPGFPPKFHASSTEVTRYQPLNDVDCGKVDPETEYQKLIRLFEWERAKNEVLKDRLDETQTELSAAKKAQSNRYVANYTKTVRRLEQEAAHYREQWENERALRTAVQEKFFSLRRQLVKQDERMDIIKFQHLPNVSPAFKDIGTVDYTLKESFNSIGNYKLGGLLGEGHYGSVHVAERDGVKYACKVLKKSKLHQFKDYQQVAIEAHVLRNYQHPGMIGLHEVLHGAENIYLILELSTMDLFTYDKEVRMSDNSIKNAIFGLLQVVSHIHKHGISHCDLKPENILLQVERRDVEGIKYDQVRLADFGLTCMAPKPNESKAIHRNNHTCGTPGFFCPEMVLENRFEGRQADMWSIGCILLELTFGFPEDWVQAYQVGEADPEAFLAGLEYSLDKITMSRYPDHKKLVQMIHSCLCINPGKRITASEALCHPWLADIAAEASKSDAPPQYFSGEWAARAYKDRESLLNATALCR